MLLPLLLTLELCNKALAPSHSEIGLAAPPRNINTLAPFPPLKKKYSPTQLTEILKPPRPNRVMQGGAGTKALKAHCK